MGAWGTAISSNDTFADIYSEFFDLYNNGLDITEISKKLIADNYQTINDKIDCNNFWFALAKAQWECKKLDKDIFDRVKKIIETGADLEVWRQLDADEKEIKKRKIILEKFLNELQTERPKAKSRKKKIIQEPVFGKGDCLTFKLESGNYGGAIVLEAIKNSEYGYNLIAATRINQPTKPTKKEFENAEVLFINYANWENKIVMQWYNPIRNKKTADLIEKLDTIDIQIDYNIENSYYGFINDIDTWIIQVADQQFKSEETKPRPISKKTIKELTKKNKWKLW
jgi:hypothetical protein